MTQTPPPQKRSHWSSGQGPRRLGAGGHCCGQNTYVNGRSLLCAESSSGTPRRRHPPWDGTSVSARLQGKGAFAALSMNLTCDVCARDPTQPATSGQLRGQSQVPLELAHDSLPYEKERVPITHKGLLGCSASLSRDRSWRQHPCPRPGPHAQLDPGGNAAFGEEASCPCSCPADV